MSFVRPVKQYALLLLFIVGIISWCQPEHPHEKDPEVLTTEELEALTVDHSQEIVFGQTGTFSGHFKIYGDSIRHGIEAYFNRMNEAGGIHGRQLRLMSVEDNGNSEQGEKNTKLLMEKHNVDMFLGTMGTRTIFKILPLVEAEKLALLFPWGGDEKLRDQKLTHLVNGLGFIEPQIDELIRHITQDLKLTKIALFHSDSDFDIANAQYAEKVLETHGLKPVIVKDYNRFSMNLNSATEDMLKADPRVVICLSSSMPAVKLINNFLLAGNFGIKFFGIDSTLFVGEILKPKGVPFYYTSSMPDPVNSALEIVAQYREDMKKHFPTDQPNVLSLAYYIHAAIACDALTSIKEPITKKKVLDAIEKMHETNIGGFEVNFDTATRQAYPQHITLIKG